MTRSLSFILSQLHKTIVDSTQTLYELRLLQKNAPEGFYEADRAYQQGLIEQSKTKLRRILNGQT